MFIIVYFKGIMCNSLIIIILCVMNFTCSFHRLLVFSVNSVPSQCSLWLKIFTTKSAKIYAKNAKYFLQFWNFHINSFFKCIYIFRAYILRHSTTTRPDYTVFIAKFAHHFFRFFAHLFACPSS